MDKENTLQNTIANGTLSETNVYATLGRSPKGALKETTISPKFFKGTVQSGAW